MEKLKQTKFKLIKRCLSLKQSFYTRYLISEKKKEKNIVWPKGFWPLGQSNPRLQSLFLFETVWTLENKFHE